MSATNTFGANGLLSRNVSGSGSIFYTFDERGNVAQRLSSSGSMLSTDLYSAFGTLLAGGGDEFGFGAKTGYYTDMETGLVLCAYRYYDPGSGRWLTRDKVGYAGGINLYAYCNSNAITNVDPSGLSPWSIIFKDPYAGGASILTILAGLCVYVVDMTKKSMSPCLLASMTALCDSVGLLAGLATCLVEMPPLLAVLCGIALVFVFLHTDDDLGEAVETCDCPKSHLPPSPVPL